MSLSWLIVIGVMLGFFAFMHHFSKKWLNSDLGKKAKELEERDLKLFGYDWETERGRISSGSSPFIVP